MDFGLEHILDDIVLICAREKWSEGSSKALLTEFGGDENKGQLAMAIMTIEGCAVADGGIVSVLHVIHRRVVMTYGVKLFKLILVLMM